MVKRFYAKVLAGGLFMAVLFFLTYATLSHTARPTDPASPALPQITHDAFGIEEGRYLTEDRQIRRNQTFSDILTAYNIDQATINALARTAKSVFDVRHLQAGKSLRIYQEASTQTARVVVYRRDPINYVVFDLSEDLQVYDGKREVTVVQREVEGTITSSPYQTLVNQGANPTLAIKLSEVFAWQIDFYRIQRGDHFKVIYEEHQIDGEPVGVGRIQAAHFHHFGEPYFAFNFGDEGQSVFYDEKGNSLRKAFLQAPLEYSRISSRYSKRRFHPVLKRYRAHLGTDYAAPTGTPIRATGDGVVLKAAYTRGNGNYVKIEHNGTYTTGYLHMSRIAKGMKPGVRVRQGQVIGYVGSTGLATGPHVCYRFWKNGEQVDPYRQHLPTARPISDELRLAFEQVRDQYLPVLLQPDNPSYLAESLSDADDLIVD